MKKEEKTELTKEKIRKAALQEFGTKGYAAASLNNICSTGISKGLLYHNFENKDAIYLDCVQQCFDDLVQALQGQEAVPDFRSYMDVRLRFFQNDPCAARLFFEAVLQPPVHLYEKLEEMQSDFNQLNRNVFQKMLSAVSLRPGVTEARAMEYFTMIQVMFNSYFSSPAYRCIPFSDMINAHEASLSKLLDLMLYGIAERGPAE